MGPRFSEGISTTGFDPLDVMVVVVHACAPLAHPLVLLLFEHRVKVLVAGEHGGLPLFIPHALCNFPTAGTPPDVTEKPVANSLASSASAVRFVQFAQEAPKLTFLAILTGSERAGGTLELWQGPSWRPLGAWRYHPRTEE